MRSRLYYLLFLTLFSCTQIIENKDCQKFKEGVFHIPFDERIGKSYYIFRLENSQVEVDNEKNETYFTVKWIDDCSYVAYLDPESVEAKKKIDLNLIMDSTLVEFQKIIEDTLFYKATSFFGETKLSYQGRMVRLGDVPPKDEL